MDENADLVLIVSNDHRNVHYCCLQVTAKRVQLNSNNKWHTIDQEGSLQVHKYVAAYSIDVIPNGCIGVLAVLPEESFHHDEAMIEEDVNHETIHIFDVHNMRERQVIQTGRSAGDYNEEASLVKINPSGCSVAVWLAGRECILIYSCAWYEKEFELTPEGKPWQMRTTLHWVDDHTLLWAEYNEKVLVLCK